MQPIYCIHQQGKEACPIRIHREHSNMSIHPEVDQTLPQYGGFKP